MKFKSQISNCDVELNRKIADCSTVGSVVQKRKPEQVCIEFLWLMNLKSSNNPTTVVLISKFLVESNFSRALLARTLAK